MSKFIIKNFVDLDDVKEMCELDKVNYEIDNQVSFEICKTWYKKNPLIYTAIFRDEELIGYINFMPISDQLYNNFVNGKIPEQSINPKDILVMKPGKSYYCLFSSVVIREDYKNSEAFLMLMTTFYRNMKTKLSRENITIKSIIADCVNKKMEKFVKDSGFKQVFKNKDYNIYEGNVF